MVTVELKVIAILSQHFCCSSDQLVFTRNKLKLYTEGEVKESNHLQLNWSISENLHFCNVAVYLVYFSFYAGLISKWENRPSKGHCLEKQKITSFKHNEKLSKKKKKMCFIVFLHSNSKI